MSTVVKDLGAVSAYAYAVEKGYTGTEEEFAELMASYATVGQTAVTAAQTATTKASEAATSATTATNKASEATTAAQTATTKAGEASTSASQASASATTASTKASEASQSASTASAKATEATTAAGTATTAKDDAVTAKNAAQTAQEAAETAQEAAEDAAKSVSASAAQIATNTADISDIKEDLGTKANDIGSYNRFDPDKAVYGIITKTGTIVADQTWMISDYIPVEPSEVLYAEYISASNYALYDADYNIVSNSNNWVNPFTVPNGVYFIRMTIDGANKTKAYVSTQNGYDAFKKITPYMHTRFGAIDNSYDAYRDGNLIDISNLTSNVYVNGAVDGFLKEANGFCATDYIPVVAGKQYYSNQNYVFRGYAAFYNANYEYISGYGNGAGLFWSNPITAPTNAAYARFTILQANISNAWLSEANRMATKPDNYSAVLNIRNQFEPNNPAEYTGNEISVFTKILCIGDSLTDGFFNEDNGSRLIIRKYSYPTQLQKLTGVECTNMGHAGYTSAQWYEAYQNEDLSGHDACIIQLGVNDQLKNVSESDMDTALTNIINKVKTDNNGIKIFVATIIPANGYMTTAMRTRSQMIRDFVSNLDDSNVYLVDLWTYGHTDDYLAYDSGHLSALGYLRLAEDYKAYISSIVKNNINDFRYVQFIGTSYTYNGTAYVREITY